MLFIQITGIHLQTQIINSQGIITLQSIHSLCTHDLQSEPNLELFGLRRVLNTLQFNYKVKKCLSRSAKFTLLNKILLFKYMNSPCCTLSSIIKVAKIYRTNSYRYMYIIYI